MSSALHTVAETPQYLKDCAAAGMTDEEKQRYRQALDLLFGARKDEAGKA